MRRKPLIPPINTLQSQSGKWRTRVHKEFWRRLTSQQNPEASKQLPTANPPLNYVQWYLANNSAPLNSADTSLIASFKDIHVGRKLANNIAEICSTIKGLLSPKTKKPMTQQLLLHNPPGHKNWILWYIDQTLNVGEKQERIRQIVESHSTGAINQLVDYGALGYDENWILWYIDQAQADDQKKQKRIGQILNSRCLKAVRYLAEYGNSYYLVWFILTGADGLEEKLDHVIQVINSGAENKKNKLTFLCDILKVDENLFQELKNSVEKIWKTRRPVFYKIIKETKQLRQNNQETKSTETQFQKTTSHRIETTPNEIELGDKEAGTSTQIPGTSLKRSRAIKEAEVPNEISTNGEPERKRRKTIHNNNVITTNNSDPSNSTSVFLAKIADALGASLDDPGIISRNNSMEEMEEDEEQARTPFFNPSLFSPLVEEQITYEPSVLPPLFSI